ncbi:choice-of-anchor L domain-containing protein [Leptobacterium sp. I13]|uniref:T9SS type B sorting domain-containing protein n=1 Tax=Leptobacterium meishanense TaxID=3128904 RepID=UPI0030ECEDDC
MKAKLSFLVSLLLSGYVSAQMVTIDDSFTPEQLIRDILIQGDCVEISNVNSPFNGAVNGINSFGFFEKGNSNFPFQEGIVLTSGDVNQVGAPVIPDPLGEGNNNWEVDPDVLTFLGIDDSFNSTTIEFDFISPFNTISFNYLMASEEYFGGFECDFSDNFAFLIKPADDSEPYRNIAVLPGTDIPISVTNIHPEIEGFCDAENEEFFDGYNRGDTNYDGRTIVLNATSEVIPLKKYRIKLIVSDNLDSLFDSAIFIEGASFNTSIDLGDDIICFPGIVLNAAINSDQALYEWYKDDVLLPEETNATLIVNDSGDYKAIVNIDLNGKLCTSEDTINVTINKINTPNDVDICDSDNDLIENFILSTKNNEILNGLDPDVFAVSYHSSLNNAENNLEPLPDNYQITNSTQSIYVRVTDINTECFDTTTFNFSLLPVPEIAIPDNVELCDADNDNTETFILSTKNNEILNGLDPDVFTVSYHSSLNNAENNLEPLPDNYQITNSTQSIYVRVTDMNTGCFNTTNFQFILHPVPIITIESSQIFCVENLPINLSAQTGLPNERYVWSTGETTPEITIANGGDYWVTVTTEFGCEASKNFSITEFDPVSIVNIDFENFRELQDVLVNTSGGSGDLLFTIDDQEPQSSNLFHDIPSGRHTITIIDQNGCPTISESFMIVNYSKFFTPNGDGINDRWHMIGIESIPEITISIFDRYGKLLKQLSLETGGWDGTYNGRLLPSSDYWFLATGQDENGSFSITGHFTLKR